MSAFLFGLTIEVSRSRTDLIGTMAPKKAAKAGKANKFADVDDLAAYLKAPEQNEEEGEEEESEEEEGEESEEEEDKGTLKRPASAMFRKPASAPAVLAVLKKPAGIDSVEKAKEARSRNKQTFLVANLDAFPPEVQDLWEKSLSGGAGARKNQTMIVNNGVKLDKQGRYSVNNELAFLEEVRTKHELRYGGHKERGEIKAIMMNMCGGREPFEEALRCGDIQETEEDGTKYYTHKTLIAGKVNQASTTRTVKRGSGIDMALHDKVAANLDSLGWSFKFTKKQLQDKKKPGVHNIVAPSAQLTLLLIRFTHC